MHDILLTWNKKKFKASVRNSLSGTFCRDFCRVPAGKNREKMVSTGTLSGRWNSRSGPGIGKSFTAGNFLDSRQGPCREKTSRPGKKCRGPDKKNDSRPGKIMVTDRIGTNKSMVLGGTFSLLFNIIMEYFFLEGE